MPDPTATASVQPSSPSRAARRLLGLVAWPLRSVLHGAAHALGAARLLRAFRSADRALLEDWILPRHAASARRIEVLFVGTRWYTRDYERLFAGHGYRTLDIDPRAARHGSSQGHVTACASRAAACFPAASFDLVVCNGVFGWGLDAREDAEAALRGFHALLREGGELVVGWNDVPAHRPFIPGELQALEHYERIAFERQGPFVLEVPGPNRHRFEFFRKPLREAPLAAAPVLKRERRAAASAPAH